MRLKNGRADGGTSSTGSSAQRMARVPSKTCRPSNWEQRRQERKGSCIGLAHRLWCLRRFRSLEVWSAGPRCAEEGCRARYWGSEGRRGCRVEDKVARVGYGEKVIQQDSDYVSIIVRFVKITHRRRTIPESFRPVTVEVEVTVRVDHTPFPMVFVILLTLVTVFFRVTVLTLQADQGITEPS